MDSCAHLTHSSRAAGGSTSASTKWPTSISSTSYLADPEAKRTGQRPASCVLECCCGDQQYQPHQHNVQLRSNCFPGYCELLTSETEKEKEEDEEKGDLGRKAHRTVAWQL